MVWHGTGQMICAISRIARRAGRVVYGFAKPDFCWLQGFVALLAPFLLFACASGSDPETSSALQTVPTGAAFAFPPPGGPAIVGVVERRFSNATQQDIALSTSSRT